MLIIILGLSNVSISVVVLGLSNVSISVIVLDLSNVSISVVVLEDVDHHYRSIKCWYLSGCVRSIKC